MKLMHYLIVIGILLPMISGGDDMYYTFQIVKSDGEFTIQELTIEKSSFASKPQLEAGEYTLVIEGIDGSHLHQQSLHLPSQITRFHDTLTDNGLEGFGEIIEPEIATFEVIIPYFDKARTIQLIGAGGQILTEKKLIFETSPLKSNDKNQYLLIIFAFALVIFLFYRYKRANYSK